MIILPILIPTNVRWQDVKFTTDGLVIRENHLGESDRVISILTRDRGVISAFVTGARKPKSKNAASTALLSYSTFLITKSKEHYRVSETEVHSVFFGIRSDIERLSLAQYICELCRNLVPEELDESEDFLRLALNSLSFLEKGKVDILLLKAIFELRIMTEAGFMPDLVGCRGCGLDTAKKIHLDCNGGEIVCDVCHAVEQSKGDTVELDRTTFTAMRHIVYSEFSKLFSFSIPSEHARYLSFVTEKYLLSQTGFKLKTLDFFHSLGL